MSPRPVSMYRAAALCLLLGAPPAVAQEGEVDLDAVGKLFAASGDLVDLRWERDRDGRLSYAGPDDAEPQPLFGGAGGLGRAFNSSGAFSLVALLVHGRGGLLGMTDGLRHLRHVGVGTSDGELIELVSRPVTAKGKGGRADVEALDRLVAIDVLRRRGDQATITRLQAVADAAGTPDPLRQRAADAIATLRGTRANGARVDPKTWLVPTAADALVFVDCARLPDLAPLSSLARSTGLVATLQVLNTLKRPTTADLLRGQHESEVCGEMPFELVRRYGPQCVDQILAAVQWQPHGSIPLAMSAQLAGAFSVERLAGLRADWPLAEDVKLTTAGPRVTIEAPGARIDAGVADAVVSVGGLHGRPRPELAADLIAGEPVLRIVFPASSKVWVGIAAAGLPPVERAEVAVFHDTAWEVRLAITARNEDAAQEWLARAKTTADELTSRPAQKDDTNPMAMFKEVRTTMSFDPGDISAKDRVVTVRKPVRIAPAFWSVLESAIRRQ